PVNFVSLNGQKCKGHPPDPGWTCDGGPLSDPECCAPTELVCSQEPCPAGDGELVMISNQGTQPEVPIPEDFFQGALFYGRANVEPEPAVLDEVGGGKPRSFTGRMLVRFTEMHLKNGATVPICGVLYQGYLEDMPLKLGERYPSLAKEGIPVLDPKY